MIELDWTAEIRVTIHAVDRAKERLGWDGDYGQDIIREVRMSLLHDRVTDVKPNWTRSLHQGQDNGEGADNSFYVWNEEATRCWVVQVMGDDAVVVKSLLLSREGDRDLADGRRYLR